MSVPKLNSPQADRYTTLRGVLVDAAQMVPKPDRTSSLMACLAEKILTLAASGEEDPTNLRRLALERVQKSCPGCRGCGGLQPNLHSKTNQ